MRNSEIGKEVIKKQLPLIPKLPGVYKMLSMDEEILYVGKAKSGILGKAPMSGASAYCASKFGAIGFLKSMELEYRTKGIQFSYFYFGGVDSPFWDDLDMNVMRDKMIPVSYAASSIIEAVQCPDHLVTGDVVIQPQSHQL